METCQVCLKFGATPTALRFGRTHPTHVIMAEFQFSRGLVVPMKRFLFWQGILLILVGPALACGPAAYQVTPTPTKTPRLIQTVPALSTRPASAEPQSIQTLAPVPTDTPVPATATFTPEPPPTNTPTPEPATTDTPPPPPPPTNTPPPPPPTQPPPPPTQPPPPPPTQPPANQGPQVIVELPDGNTYDPGEEFDLVIIVRDPDGVVSFTWGVFTQNQTPLVGGDENCNRATECRIRKTFNAPPIAGTYLAGADALDTKGATTRGVGEIYVH